MFKLDAQTLNGYIKNENGESIQGNIYIKDSIDSDLISEYYQSSENGYFNIKIQTKISKIIFEIRAMGYKEYKDSIVDVKIDKTYYYNIRLKTEEVNLEELVVATERKIVIKNDTTDYYPKTFLNGTERKIEDLIKRLPGMEVSDNGKIKYFGKVVETVSLDGDDLFGNRYSIGTKNISVDLVEKIQAIDNFASNPLLKGIINSETVSLNIILKKTKTKLNTDAQLGFGVGVEKVIRRDIGLNVLAFNNRVKSFGNLNHNNIGLSNSNNDYSIYNEESNTAELKPQYASIILPNYQPSSAIKSQNALLNSEYTGSYNLLSRLSKKILLKSNIFYSQNTISKTEVNTLIFFKEGFSYNDTSNFKHCPKNYEVASKIEYSINKKNLLTFESKLSMNNINHEKETILNQTQKILESQNTKGLYWTTTSEFTRKLNQNSALQLKSTYTQSYNLQYLHLNSSTSDFLADLQKVNTNTQYYQNQLFLYLKTKYSKINISIGNSYNESCFFSNLSKAQKTVNEAQNDFQYNFRTIYAGFLSDTKFANWQFKPELKISSLINSAFYRLTSHAIKANDLLITPKIVINYSKNTLHKFTFNGEIAFLNTPFDYLYTQTILENPRTLKNNVVNLDLQRKENISFSYRYYEPFAFFSSFILFYLNKNTNSFINNLQIQEQYTTITYFKTPISTYNSGISIGLDKLVSPLKTSFKYSTSLSKTNYFNQINNSELRNNYSYNQSHSLFLKTGFSSPFGFENRISFTRTKFETNKIKSNTLSAFENTYKFIYKPNNNWMLINTLNSFIPQLNQKSKFHFFDFEINYKPEKKVNSKSKIIEYRFIGNNIFNTRFYTTVENSDFATTQFQSNLIGRYFISSIMLRF